MMTTRFALLAVLGLAVAPIASAQAAAQHAPAPLASFQVEFFLTSQQGSAAPLTHNYLLLLRVSDSGSTIRTGDKIPIASDGKHFTYQDTGVSLYCALSPRPAPAGTEPLNVAVTITSLASQLSPAATTPPRFATVSTHVQTQVPLDHRQIIASFDDISTRVHYQLAVLVRPVG